MATLTHDYVEVAEALKSMLEAQAPEIGLHAVWYGDQETVPVTPSVAIDPAPTDFNRYGTGHQYAIRFSCAVMLYYAQVTSQQELQIESDKYTMKVLDAINASKNLDGLIVHGNVVRVEPGVARRAGARFRASRIMWEGIGRALIHQGG
jgi:hypothetical protein